MKPDHEALEEFRRGWRNFFVAYPEWDHGRVERFINEQIKELAQIPSFYNNPPAFTIARELIPKDLLDRLDAQNYRILWQELYDALESEGHWSFFDDGAARSRIHRRIAEILNSHSES